MKTELEQLAEQGWNSIPAENRREIEERLVKRINEKYPLGQPKVVYFSSRNIAIAVASVAAVIAIIVSNQIGISIQDLAKDVYAYEYHPEALLSETPLAELRSSSKEAERESIKRKGVQAYMDKDFEQAASFFGKYTLLQSSVSELYLYLGHAQLQFAPEQAITTLEGFIKEHTLDEGYTDLARWYLAWAYYKQGDMSEAKEIATSLLETSMEADATTFLKYIQTVR